MLYKLQQNAHIVVLWTPVRLLTSAVVACISRCVNITCKLDYMCTLHIWCDVIVLIIKLSTVAAEPFWLLLLPPGTHCRNTSSLHQLYSHFYITWKPFWNWPGMRCRTTSETRRSVRTFSGRGWRRICFGMHLDTLEALRNALYNLRLTYLLTFCSDAHSHTLYCSGSGTLNSSIPYHT